MLTPGNRFCSLRLLTVLNILRNGDSFNCTDLAGTFNTCTKTIWRDIAALREAGYMIDFDARANTFRLAAPEYHI